MIKAEFSVEYKLFPVKSAGAFGDIPDDGRFGFLANHADDLFFYKLVADNAERKRSNGKI